ncbi:hypothetical protein ACOJUR_10775 [Alicyclobacillus tolerans]|uniref:hypothetical protein n=1 Tax=Alicyclobacillus TaxID=29330 RepID=UPI001934341C|nr:hypothetical protein [Alicyclobacillus sp. TC]QRF23179.1 hypothetical protein FY534_05465 [Alicyclobacillus sp. TC]
MARDHRDSLTVIVCRCDLMDRRMEQGSSRCGLGHCYEARKRGAIQECFVYRTPLACLAGILIGAIGQKIDDGHQYKRKLR